MKFSQSVLENLEPRINEIKNHIIEVLRKNAEKEGKIIQITSYDEEMIYLGLVLDMLKSFEKHTEPTDKLISVTSYLNNNGSLNINCLIERENIEYQYNTEAILAGGYNIQKLHYRYLTNTKLPNTKNTDNSLSTEFDVKIKKLSKIKKFELEIKNFEERIEKNKQIIEKSSNYSDEEIIKQIFIENPRIIDIINTNWKQIVERGADENYDNEEDFCLKQKEFTLDQIERWKRKNILWKQQDNKEMEKSINKIKIKITKIK